VIIIVIRPSVVKIICETSMFCYNYVLYYCNRNVSYVSADFNCKGLHAVHKDMLCGWTVTEVHRMYRAIEKEGNTFTCL
jgi:hypothetical protein